MERAKAWNDGGQGEAAETPRVTKKRPRKEPGSGRQGGRCQGQSRGGQEAGGREQAGPQERRGVPWSSLGAVT